MTRAQRHRKEIYNSRIIDTYIKLLKKCYPEVKIDEILDRVFFHHEQFVVTRKGLPFVSIKPVPPETDFDQTEKTPATVVRQKTSEIFGAINFRDRGLLIMRRDKPMALVTSLRKIGPGHTA